MFDIWAFEFSKSTFENWVSAMHLHVHVPFMNRVDQNIRYTRYTMRDLQKYMVNHIIFSSSCPHATIMQSWWCLKSQTCSPVWVQHQLNLCCIQLKIPIHSPRSIIPMIQKSIRRWDHHQVSWGTIIFSSIKKQYQKWLLLPRFQNADCRFTPCPLLATRGTCQQTEFNFMRILNKVLNPVFGSSVDTLFEKVLKVLNLFGIWRRHGRPYGYVACVFELIIKK